MAGTNTIPVGINILAKEEITKPFERIVSLMDRFKNSLGKAQDQAKAGLAGATGSVAAAQGALPPIQSPKNPKMDPIHFSGGVRGLGESAENFTQGMDKLAGTLKNFLFLMVGAGGVTYGLKKFSEGLTGSVLDLNQLSSRVALPIQDIRQLSYVAQAAGVSASSLHQALTHLSDAQFDVKMGIPSEAGKAALALKDKLLNPNGSRRNLKDLFTELTKRLAHIHDPTLRSRVTSAVFGSDELLKLTALGPKKTDALMRRFQVNPFSKDLTENAREYQATVTELDASLDRLKFTAGKDILQGFGDGLKNTQKLIDSNNSGVSSFISQLATKLPQAIPAVFKCLDGLASALGAIDKSVGLVNVTLGIFSLYTLAKLVTGIAALSEAFATLGIGAFLAGVAGPILAITAALGGLYLAVQAIGAIGPSLPKNDPLISATAWKTRVLPDDYFPKKSVQPTPPKSAAPPLTEQQQSLIRIVFENAPTGMRIKEKSGNQILTDLGFNLGGAH